MVVKSITVSNKIVKIVMWITKTPFHVFVDGTKAPSIYLPSQTLHRAILHDSTSVFAS